MRVGENLAEHEKRHWREFGDKASKHVSSFVELAKHPSMKNLKQVGKDTLSLAASSANAVMNDEVLGIPLKIADATVLPQIGLVKTGLEIADMAASGDTEGSETRIADEIAGKVLSKSLSYIPGYKQLKTVNDILK